MNADPEGQSILIQLILLVVLTALNAFFAASEMALVSVNRSRVEQRAAEGDKKYSKLLSVINNPSNFLSTIQVGITLINILTGASLAETLAAKLVPYLGHIAGAKTIAQVIVLALLTYFSIVFGELYPKRIAQNLKESLAVKVVTPIQILGVIMKPFVWLLASSTNLLSKLTPMKFDDHSDNMTRDEIEYLLNTSAVALDSDEREMLAGIFSLDELVAREIMVPRTDASMIDIQDDTAYNIKYIIDSVYSRFPVYDDDKDKIIGILHTKNLLREAYNKGFENVDILSIMQEPLFVPETIYVDDLMKELKRTKNQMAILLNEYGGVEGIVTLEDLLEEIVGEIEDESDAKEDPEVEQISDNLYQIKGRMPLSDFNEEFKVELENNDVDTIAGFFVTEIGTIPGEDEHINLDLVSKDKSFTLTNLKMEGPRVDVLQLEFFDTEDKEEKEED
ncbi:hemolysin family protein [Floricoccus penangensis]|uniref:Hemolysin n=1 Tax=Floricoccus penangensis TaxID=1859475 RepID=A0A9Q5P0L6_9LACT|nr:hemolysin family protein [Floricoccus penangensis]OFI46475.1 hemolysin [Floricoccus penangensis]URZ87232.1 hemolysin family protein [Floricoccus penangensis]